MRSKKEKVATNASSMADIAFLLLIFFLVTTTIDTDKGIMVKLPQWYDKERVPEPISKRNVLEILINEENMLLVEGAPSSTSELKEMAFNFLDNNGGKDCSYCSGMQNPNSSDHPQKAVISLLSHRATNYETYIHVYDELIAAYHDLRDKAAIQQYNHAFQNLTIEQKGVIKDLYPMLLSESEPIN